MGNEMSEDGVLHSENLMQELTEASQHESREYTSYLFVRAREEIRRLSEVTTPKVKPLEWRTLPFPEEYGQVYFSDTLMGKFSVSETTHHGWGIWIINGSNKQLLNWNFANDEEAKSVAELHLKEAILDQIEV